MTSFYVYMLKCRDGSYYTGHTDDLGRRIEMHNDGLIKGYTSERLPVELVWFEEKETRHEAFLIERAIKKWSRFKKEALIRNDRHLLSEFSKKNFNKNSKIKAPFLRY